MISRFYQVEIEIDRHAQLLSHGRWQSACRLDRQPGKTMPAIAAERIEFVVVPTLRPAPTRCSPLLNIG
jgi:hypothetical protein